MTAARNGRIAFNFFRLLQHRRASLSPAVHHRPTRLRLALLIALVANVGPGS